MRSAVAWIGILGVLAVSRAPAAAEPRRRVALFQFEGDRGGAMTDAVAEILAHAHTVVPDSAIAASLARQGLTGSLGDRDYASLATAVAADAIVLGTCLKVGRRWRLALTVRDGRTGARVTDLVFVVQRRGRALDAAGERQVAAGLVPAVDGVAPITGAPGPAAVAAAPAEPAEPAPDAPPGAVPAPAPALDAADHAALPAPSDPVGGLGPIGGKAFAYLRAPVDGDAFQQVSASLWLHARPELGAFSYARWELAIDAFDAAIASPRRLRASLREAYVALRGAGWLLRVGQQIIPWGSSDVINPTDFLTARDLTYFAADPEQSRVGAISVLVSKAWSALEITAVATPRAAVSTLLIPAAALPPGVTLAPGEARGLRLADTDVAVKIKLSGARWDLAAVGFRGHNHVPELELASLDARGAVLRQTNHRIRAAGIDGSASTGKLVLRAEAAYIATEHRGGADPTIQPSCLHGVLGVERPIGERLRVQAQLVGRLYVSWRAPETAVARDEATTQVMRGLAASNALLLDYQDPRSAAATVRAAYTSEQGKLEAELFAALRFAGRDYVVRPLVGWHPTDALTVQVGLEAYGGSRSRPLGVLEPFGGVFTQVTFAF